MDVAASPVTGLDGKATPEVLRLKFERAKQRSEGRVFVCSYCQKATNLSCSRCHTPLCKTCEQLGRCCAMVMPDNTFVPAVPATPQSGRDTEAASSSRGPKYDAEQAAREAVQGLADAASLIASGDAEQTEQDREQLIEEAQFVCSICSSIGGAHLCCRSCEYFACIKCISDESVEMACACGLCDRRAWIEIQSKRQKIQDTRKKIKPINIEKLAARLQRTNISREASVEASGDAEQVDSSVSSSKTRTPFTSTKTTREKGDGRTTNHL